ncbi:MAG TPA: NYN domain-containing protein [Gemmatimonadales bacterium]|nr:NYN domain-containing protein [Gemmatimonadales bacterium]
MNQILRSPRGERPLHAPNAALLIDFDNVTLGVRSDLTKELKTLLSSDIIKGKVAVQRAYADWRRYPQYIVPLSESSIDLIFAPAFGTNKKNATDIRLAIDAIELVFTRPEIGTFILLSGDSDFSTMVIKLKEYGKYVIGVGIRESASDLLIQNCDEYYSYSDLAGLTKEVDIPSTQKDPWELVRLAVAQMTKNHDVMRSDRLKQVMQQIDPNFDEKNAGFNRFSKFLVEAGNRKLLRVTKLENGQYDIGPLDGQEAVPAAAASEEPAREEGPRRRGGRGRGRHREGPKDPTKDVTRDAPRRAEAPRPPATRGGSSDQPLTLAQAFELMRQSLGELGSPVAAEAVRNRMAAMNGRNDPLLEKVRFERFLRQAHDAEVADVKKLGEDDFEISTRPGFRIDRPATAVPLGAEASTPAPGAGQAARAEAAAPVNGKRAGLRFRRGARGGITRQDIPMVGVVSVEEPVAAPVEKAKPAGRRPTRGKGRTPKALTETAAAVPAVPAEPAAAVRKPRRPRARKA